MGDFQRACSVLLLGAAVGAGAANAAPVSAVVAAGDCRDPDLLADARLLSEALQERAGNRILSDEAVREKLEMSPPASLEDLELRLHAARSLFYNGQADEAEQRVRAVLEDSARLTPGQARATLTQNGRLLHALILRALKRNDEADGAFRQVLRLSPSHALDPMLYPPTLIRRFDAIKKEMASAKKVALTVVTQPSGATVFIDGVAFGKSPHNQALLPDTYVVTVGKDKAFSLPHRVSLKEPTTLRVDLAFEQRVDPQRLLCISDDGAVKGRLEAALKLAAPLDVDTLYLVRLEPPGNAPGWFAASVIDVKSAQKTREGGLKLQSPGRPPDGITELANFILTGEAKGKVHAGPLSAPAGPAPSEALPGANEVQLTHRGDKSWKTPAGWAAGGVGLVAAGAGVIFGLQSSSAWSDFNAHYQNGRSPDVSRADSLKALQDSAESKKGLATVSFITAGVGLVAGTYLLWSDNSLPFFKRSDVRAELSVGPSSLLVTIR